MVWLWISMIVVLVGAALNAEMEHQDGTQHDAERKAKAVGARRATMEDTMGHR
jgi:membrane protein